MSKPYYLPGYGRKQRRTLLAPLLMLGILLFGAVGMALFSTNQTSALSGSEFKSGRIVDDGIFFNVSTMTPGDIQNFLNSKVPTCDTNGTTMYNGSQTRAQYGASKGYPAPYTCLKDYTQNTPSMGGESGLCNPLGGGVRNAAQIIYDSATACGINPQVLLTLLQKEQSLITDDWPWPIQYQNATGFGCPDTAPCDPQYSGFFYQVYNAARQFKKYARDQDQFSYKAYRNNNILYNPNSSCGASSIYLENQATADLYIYTPYQPNQAALDNLYGTGDSCSSYGNRNFWRMFNDWFGPTISDSLYYAVIQGPNSPALYLQTVAGKYYIPTGAIMHDWGIDTLPVRQVSQSYVDSLPTQPWLGRVLKDDWNNYFVVDDGKLHYVRDPSYLALWNLDASTAVRSLGLTYRLPSDTWLGRFVRDVASPTGTIWLVDKGQKHAVSDASLLYQWRYTPDQLTTVSTAFLNSLPTAAAVTQYASGGSSHYLVDSGQKLTFANANVENGYFGSSTPGSYDPATLSFLPTAAVTLFVQNASNGQWFMLEGGNKHYIPDARLAEVWGKPPSGQPTRVSPDFLASLPDTGNLTYVVQSSSPSMYWVIDGSKRYIGSSAVASAWLKPNSSPPVYSNQSLNTLPRGADATTALNPAGSPYNYTMDNGVRHYMMSAAAQSAWGGTIMNISPQLNGLVPEGAFVNQLVRTGSGQAYLLVNGTTSYIIDPSYYSSWGISNTTSPISDEALSRYPSSPYTLKTFVRIGSTHYAMIQGRKSAIRNFSDAYPATLPGEVTLPVDYFDSTSDASYLIRSSDTSDSRVWLMNQGKKIDLTFEQQVTFGYLSKGVQPTVLPPAALNAIPDDTRPASLLIQKQNSGIKLLSFGSALGFPNSDTLLNYAAGTNGVLQVSPSIFDAIILQRTASRLVRDDYGNYFWIENGVRHYIPSGAILSHYSSSPVSYLEGTTLYLIPIGADLTQ